MKILFRMRARKEAMILLSIILTMSGGLFSLEPPTKPQLAKYRLDGTLAQHIADAKAFGNHRVEPASPRVPDQARAPSSQSARHVRRRDR